MFKKFLLPVAILLAANYLIKKYMMIEKVNFLIKKINFNGNILHPNLILTIEAINPINTAAKITDLISDIFVNNKKIGVATNDFDIVIGANRSSMFDFKVSILPITAIASIFDIFNRFGGEIKLTGSAKVDGIFFPIDIKYNI
jgi:hypothetical protein